VESDALLPGRHLGRFHRAGHKYLCPIGPGAGGGF
jgi:hypothetical protein